MPRKKKYTGIGTRYAPYDRVRYTKLLARNTCQAVIFIIILMQFKIYQFKRERIIKNDGTFFCLTEKSSQITHYPLRCCTAKNCAEWTPQTVVTLSESHEGRVMKIPKGLKVN